MHVLLKVTSVEEMKALKTQVISLTKEIDSSNEKIKALEELLGQQKDRYRLKERLHRTAGIVEKTGTCEKKQVQVERQLGQKNR